MDCSTPGFPVLHQLPEVAQTHVHQVKLMSIESRGELGSPNTEGAASIAYGEKIQLSIVPSLVVRWKEQALEERTGPDYLGPGEVDTVRQRICQLQSLSSFFSLVGSDPLTVQGRMTCWYEEDGRISGSWQFGFNGEMCLRFDSENGHWTVDHSAGRRIKEKWEKDRAVSNFFKKVSMGDCRAWLRDFLVRWEEMLTTTGK